MTLLTADYILDENFQLRRGWAVKIAGRRIADIGPSHTLRSSGAWVNLGRAVLMPGFVNCHNHLELTSLGHDVHRTKDFVKWLDEVRALRDGKDDDYLATSAREGVARSLTAGVTTIADHCNSGLALDALSSMPVRALILYELIALDKKTFKQRLPLFKERIRNTRENVMLSWGLAPHALYSVSPELFDWVRKTCERKNRVVSIHIHEHRDEAEFLKTGKGGFRKMLERLGTNVDEFDPPGVSPVEYVRSLGILRKNVLLVHSNYVSRTDIQLVAKSGAAVVYCPRSHHYFYHKKHPLAKMLKAGVRVALGTDSLASNWSLSILDEARFVRKRYPKISGEDILRMATISGAEALGMGNIGRLAPGMGADMAALGNLPDKEITIDDLLTDGVENIFTMVAGREVFKKTKE